MTKIGFAKLQFANGEYEFRLPLMQLEELQEKTGVGPFALWRRITEGEWLPLDPIHTIRLALIGGGTKPAEAAKLVERYVVPYPLAEAVPFALAALSACLFGIEVPDEETQEPAIG